MAFKIGDIVRLNSGGPEMTYTGCPRGDQFALCTWFCEIPGNVEPLTAEFPVEALHAVNKTVGRN